MQPTNYEKRFYTPQFSEMATVTVRRLAWALGIPMTKAVDIIFKELGIIFPSSEICPKCKDRTKCHACAFNNQAAAESTATSKAA